MIFPGLSFGNVQNVVIEKMRNKLKDTEKEQLVKEETECCFKVLIKKVVPKRETK